MKKRNHKHEERYCLTPKACLMESLSDTSISDIDLSFNEWESGKFHSTYIVLERRMYEAGYITDEKGETKDHKDSDTPEAIFKRTIKGFYTDATEEQIAAAWDLFVFLMER